MRLVHFTFHLNLLRSHETLKSSRALLGHGSSESSQFLSDVVHKGGKPDMLIFIHKIAVNEGSWNLLQIVSSMARRMSLMTHENKSSWSAPSALLVCAACNTISLSTINFTLVLSTNRVGHVADFLISVDLHR